MTIPTIEQLTEMYDNFFTADSGKWAFDERDLIHFLQSRPFALRTNRECVIGVMLKYLGLLQAIIAMVNVDWHFILPSCKRWPACRCEF